MTAPVLAPALDAAAAAAVVRAACEGRAVVVPHRLPPDVAGDDAELERLSAELPNGWTRGVDADVATVTGRPPAELGAILPQQRDTPTVTRLYHLQRSPQLRPLTDAVYDSVERAWPASEPWLERDAGFFLSSQGGVTPAHADRHHNLLLQLSGSKQIGIAVPGSRAHAAAVARSYPSLIVDDMPPGGETLVLLSGFALYLPPYSVHWVRSTERSVAMSCGWSSPLTIRTGKVYAANARLLRLGLPAKPVGGLRDDVKLRAVAAARRLRSVTHRR